MPFHIYTILFHLAISCFPLLPLSSWIYFHQMPACPFSFVFTNFTFSRSLISLNSNNYSMSFFQSMSSFIFKLPLNVETFIFGIFLILEMALSNMISPISILSCAYSSNGSSLSTSSSLSSLILISDPQSNYFCNA